MAQKYKIQIERNGAGMKRFSAYVTLLVDGEARNFEEHGNSIKPVLTKLGSLIEKHAYGLSITEEVR